MSIQETARKAPTISHLSQAEKLRLQQRQHRQAKKRLKLRLTPSDRAGLPWPRDAKTFQDAALLEDDVRGKADPEPVSMKILRHEAGRPIPIPLVPGLEPIDEHLVKRRHGDFMRERAAEDAMRGPWTIERVDSWLVHAMATLFRLPLHTRPAGYKTSMPAYVTEFADMVARQENKSLRRLRGRLTRELGPVTAIDYRRMEEAAGWQAHYLRDIPEVARVVGLGALWKAIPGKAIKKRCRDLGMWPSKFFEQRKRGLMRIAEGLTRDGKVAT